MSIYLYSQFPLFDDDSQVIYRESVADVLTEKMKAVRHWIGDCFTFSKAPQKKIAEMEKLFAAKFSAHRYDREGKLILSGRPEASEKEREKLNAFAPQSTYGLRSALLLASLQDGAGLESWQVYTKNGQAVQKQELWAFVE